VTKSYISEIERGHRSPRLITLKALARRLNRPLSHFLDGVPEDREVEAFLRLGLVRLRSGMPGSACAPLERALELAVQQGDEVLQARVELALAAVDQELGHVQRAQRRLDRCFRVLARAGETALLVAAHSCLGRIKLASGDPDSAVWAFQAAIQLAGQQPDDPILLSSLYLDLGIAQRTLGHGAAAREAFRLGLEVARSVQEQDQVAARNLELADVAAGEGRFGQTFEHAGRAQGVYEILAHQRRLAKMHEYLGELAAEEGAYAQAERHYWCGLGLHGASGGFSGPAHALSGIALILLERASPDAAQMMCEAAFALLAGEADRPARAHAFMVLGTIHQRQRRGRQARAAFQEGLALFDALNREGDVRRARQTLALLALEDGDTAEARRYVEGLQETPTVRGL
jgi:tetratricopeptide (TPR) repeat protein